MITGNPLHIYKLDRNALLYGLSALVLIPAKAMAQVKANYVRTETIISKQADKITDYQFYDGLGRPAIAATSGLSGTGEYSYTLKEYTGESSVVAEWLPAGGTQEIECLRDNEVKQRNSSQYSGDDAYANYEFDILGRVTKSVKPGAKWKQWKGTESAYLTNSDKEVKKYKWGQGGSIAPVESGYYKAGSLTGVRETDEDGVTTTVFTDAFGRKILERRGESNDTYFVYDQCGRLAFVLMPGYQSVRDPEKYTYRYTYNVRGNLIRKQLPGCAAVEFTYDANDRCVSFQDGELRKKGLYRIFLYDKLGRMAVQGLASRRLSPEEAALVTFSKGCGGIAGTDYSSPGAASINSVMRRLEQATFYDDYQFMEGTAKKYFQGLYAPDARFARGTVTGLVTSVSNGQTMSAVIAYDIKGRIVGTQGMTTDGRCEQTENRYTYSDKLAVSRQSVRGAGLDAVETVVTNEYGKSDDRLRSTTVSVTVNGRSTDKRQITYDYDRLGRLAKVIRPLTSPSRSGIAYSYNIQGWVDKIETGSFSESLHYNEGPGRHLFNGNVSSVNWSRKGETGNRGYKFDYDRLNRLTGAEYGEKDFSLATGRYDEQLRYDADGNVQALSRNGRKQNGSYGPVDDLTLSYDGCQLSAVEERAAPVVSANSYDLKRGSDDFAYNDNGALTMDGTRGITNITYDYGGYPAKVQFDNGNVTKYVYTSTGQKLRAVYYTAMPNVRVGMGMDYDGIEDNHLSVDSVDYLLGGTVLCRNGRATQILFDGGYVKVERRLPGLWKNPSLLSLIPNVPIITNDSLVLQPNPADTLRLTFKYFNKDHLGNIREVIGEDGGVEQVTDYYPFGLPIGDLGRNGGLQRFKYNGKEFDEMHGLNTYDYGARQYNPVLARWDRMDPLCGLFQNVSAFAYCHDNPVNFIDFKGLFDSQDEAIGYAYHHYTGLSNVHYAFDKDEWFVSFGENGMGYSHGGTLERRFQEKISERSWWKTVSNDNTYVGTGLGFSGWVMEKPLTRSNAYAFRDGTGQYVNTAKPTFRFRNMDVDFSLKNANKIAKGIKYLGAASGLASGVMTAIEIWQDQKKIIGEGGLDLIMTSVGFIPPYGWAISSAYFLGKSALEYNDMDFWNKPQK